MPYTILVYNVRQADEYRELLGELLPGHRIVACRTPEEARLALPEAEILFCWRFPTALLPLASRLRWVQTMSAGVEDMVKAPLPPGCVLSRVEGLFSEYMSEYAFCHMLADAEQLRRLYRNQAEQRWERFRIGKLAGKRLGVAGAGSIGSAVAAKGKAFGMEVWALVRTPRQVPHADRVFTPEAVDEFTAGVDYLVSTLPHTPETVGLIDPERMKPGALLINMGRGATIDEEALLRAVRTRGIRAVLDVFVEEPLPQGHRFWTEPGITVTPHLSGPSIPAEVARYFVDNLRRLERGEPLRGLVDRQRGY